jgi:hypothetical protein
VLFSQMKKSRRFSCQFCHRVIRLSLKFLAFGSIRGGTIVAGPYAMKKIILGKQAITLL